VKVDPKPDPANNVKSIYIRVLNAEQPIVQKDVPKPVKFDDPKKAVEVPADVKIAAGSNIIRVFDETRPNDETDSITIVCEGEKCSAAAAATKEPEKPAKIKIDKPEKGSKEASVVDTARVDAYLTIAGDSEIKDIQYSVVNEGDTKFTSEKFPVPAPEEKDKQKQPIKMRIPVAILKGSNAIRFFNAADPANKDSEDFTEVVCTGENCALNYQIAKYPSSGQNSRVIVGLEQAGGSSAKSETKPVLDLFFMTPFLFDKRHTCPEPATEECLAENTQRRLLPRLGFWGDIRVASTPDQIAAAGVFPTNLVNQVTHSGEFIDLVQSFDFMAGLEGRIKTANSSFLSLIPGIRQKSSFYLAAGWGAISPLTARRESVQIFNVPGPTDPRRANFIERFGVNGQIPKQLGDPTKEAEFVAITPLDRDRFLHQWYAGIRLKTFYCEDEKCTRFKNSFPSIVDFMIGQNEAVTGGSRKRGGTPDPNNPDKLIGQSNSFVLRIDGFYPFPIKEANFLFLYGTALMKVGGGGVKITTPLFLDNPGTTVELSDPRLYVPPIGVLKLQQPDRDYYKIGVGINLTDLFNRNKPKP